MVVCIPSLKPSRIYKYGKLSHAFLAHVGMQQWCSQNTADARAQRGHTTFARSFVPRPRLALSRLQYGMQKQLGGSGGCSPIKFWNF